MLVFDSASVPIRDRQSAIVESITSAAAATFMTPVRGAESIHLRMHAWDLGGVEVVDARCSAHTMRRSPRQAAGENETVLAFTCAQRGRGVHRQLGHEFQVRPSEIWATNFAEPYTHHVTDTWTTTAKVPLRLLGVPDDLVGPALQHVGRSPLAPLLSHHISHVRRVADDLNDAAAASLGTATVALARAVFTSVAGDEALGREALHDILLLRVRAHIREHLADADLGPTSIAAANHVSVRQLFKACAHADLHLEQWIIAQRLERAHEDLARLTPTPLPITQVAQRWGFSSASHFARRFRSAYGMSPREWQALNRQESNPGTAPP